MSHAHHEHSLEEEAEAFNERIEERSSAGFVPDLRRNQRCEYFYKSFWRDPVFSDLYVGEMYRNYSRLLSTHLPVGSRVLDAGCGAGYFALELARDGHHVVGIDIAEKAIMHAQKALQENTFTEGFGSLEYQVSSVEELLQSTELEKFDAILYSGVLHHLEDIESILIASKQLLRDGGIILGHEPCHENWTTQDASVVVLIRSLLALCGKWYEPVEEIIGSMSDEDLLSSFAEIKTEYVEERDKSEAGQSPHDNTFNGTQILACVEKHFALLENKPSSSFIYRVLGGVRSDVDNEHEIARFLAQFDKTCVASGLLNPNYFYFCARK